MLLTKGMTDSNAISQEVKGTDFGPWPWAQVPLCCESHHCMTPHLALLLTWRIAPLQSHSGVTLTLLYT